MKIEHKGNIYKANIKKPILKGDLYYDCMTHEIKKCMTYICFDPWSLKMELIKNKNEDNEKFK